MVARYGDRTELGNPVANWGRQGAAAPSEITFVASPAPAVTSAPVLLGPSTAAQEYIVLTVTGSTTITFAGAPANAVADVVVVAGGGAGGSTSPTPSSDIMFSGGGGGGGGVVIATVGIQNIAYPIIAGGGGAAGPGNGGNGTNSSAFGLTASGGGGGATTDTAGLPGGSGGGAGGRNPLFFRSGGSSVSSPSFPGLIPTSAVVQGTPGASSFDTTSAFPIGGQVAGRLGGAGGGGGGDSGFSMNSFNLSQPSPNCGGNGAYLLNVFGPVAYVAGGGGGFSPFGGAQALGGLGGGGNGGRVGPPSPRLLSTAGAPNSGGGGGGGGSFPAVTPVPGSAGGSGVVLIRYQRFQA